MRSTAKLEYEAMAQLYVVASYTLSYLNTVLTNYAG